MKTRRIVFDAMLTAMFFALSMLSIDLGNAKMTFSGLPVIVAGALFGPVDGFIVGALGSFMEQMLKYGFTPTTVLWILPAAIRGLLVGLYAKRKRYSMTNAETIGVLVVTAVVLTTLNTAVWYADSVIYHYYSFAAVFGNAVFRYLLGALTAVAYAAVLPMLLPVLKKVLHNQNGGIKNE